MARAARRVVRAKSLLTGESESLVGAARCGGKEDGLGWRTKGKREEYGAAVGKTGIQASRKDRTK
jgi:hypothetical protein